jgi:hypothetical protein
LQRTAGNQTVSALISQIREGDVGVQRAGPGQAVANRPGSAAKVLSPIEQNHAAYQATFQRWWSGQPLEQRAKWFVVFNSLSSKSGWASSMMFIREVYGNSGVPRTKENIADFYQFFPPLAVTFFRDTVPKEVERDLLADPARAVAVWSDLLGQFQDRIEQTPVLKDFSNRLENSVFRAYASQGLEAGKGGKPPSHDKVTATQTLVRQMIVDDTQDYKVAGLAGVAQWALPYMKPETMVDWLSGSSAAAGATGSIIGVWALEEGILVAAGFTGIGLLAAGAALGIAAAYRSATEKEAAERERVLEAGVKRAIIDGFLEIATLIRRNEDVIALRLIGDARKDGQKISLEHRASLEPWVWRKLFGSFPRDDKAGAQTVANRIDELLSLRHGR